MDGKGEGVRERKGEGKRGRSLNFPTAKSCIRYACSSLATIVLCMLTFISVHNAYYRTIAHNHAHYSQYSVVLMSTRIRKFYKKKSNYQQKYLFLFSFIA